ncbi:hypothetical protein FNV66_48465 [Streptomyces sp. S1D4-14]|nr:hypothetical protein FNV67_49615 [Streptomyces sp. S1D4-20]QDN72298.1 hypothetical protein FNV66_48465 [Streptomyces sp. S1D4-14]QDO54755.1 hypothetical protein FNV60_46935 [Streptomyces sp. RLB3-5]QDO64999.1 hypothetical protein FNV59_49190 [Streptomyces sp. RLB1-8]
MAPLFHPQRPPGLITTLVGARAVSGGPLLGQAGLWLGHTVRRFEHLSDEGVAPAYSLAARAEAAAPCDHTG